MSLRVTTKCNTILSNTKPRIVTLGITTFSIMAISKTIHSIMTLSMTTLDTMTPSKKTLSALIIKVKNNLLSIAFLVFMQVEKMAS